MLYNPQDTMPTHTHSLVECVYADVYVCTWTQKKHPQPLLPHSAVCVKEQAGRATNATHLYGSRKTKLIPRLSEAARS